ncbi:MAG TPA: septal ring lytic transglycosylase RlpA family protein [Pseudoxanthomonas sp.]
MRWLALPLMALTLAACSSAPKKSAPPPSAKVGHVSRAQPPQIASGTCSDTYAPAQEDPAKRGDYKAGGLYAPHIADTTPDHIPNVDCIAEPLVTNEPRSPVGNRPSYSVLGKKYQVMDRADGYVEQGKASYYGNKFHGRRTSNQEVYDMYAFTAAHKTLPLPSFARVTNLDNGKSLVVRVNDRGPFHEGRVIDLSYAAAVKLDIVKRGVGRVEVRALTGKEDTNLVAARAPAAPARTTIATGKPTPMDALIDALPASAAQAVAANPPAVPAMNESPAQPWRYHVAPTPEKTPSADEFEAWMRSRGVRVATGKPATPGTVPATTEIARTPRETEELRPAPAMVAFSPGDVQLQVASFASRENADRALARLNAAGIDRASLSDVDSNGRKLWRLRVGAADQTAASEIAGRIASLGFGQPQVVRE